MTNRIFALSSGSDQDIKNLKKGTYTANIAGDDLDFLTYDYEGDISTNKSNGVSNEVKPGHVHTILRSFKIKNLASTSNNNELTYQSVGVRVYCTAGDQDAATQAENILKAIKFIK